MSWLFKLLDAAGVNQAVVDADGQVATRLSDDPAKAGAVKLYDASGNPIVVEENGALSVSQDALLFCEQVDGNSINTNRWTYAVSGMTVVQASGFITLNNGGAVTAGAYAILQSILQIPFYGTLPVEVEISGKVPVQPQSNFTVEIGVGSATGAGAPTDGCFFRWSPSGAFLAVVNNAGGETTVAITPIPVSDVQTLFGLTIAEDHVQFSIDDELVADIQNPAGLAFPFSAGHQPLFMRVFNAGSSPGAAPKFSLGQATAFQASINQVRPWTHVLSDQGMAGYQSPVSPFTQTPNRGASSSPSSLSLSNTTPSLTTLGGEWQVAALAAANTDYALMAYQVPAPFKLRVYGIHVWACTLGAAIVTPTMLDWALGLNSSAASLATAESPPATWAPKRIPIGRHLFAASAPVGTAAPDVYRRFEVPMIVDAGRFLHVILRIPNGANTANLLYSGGVFIDAQHE